MQMWQITSAQRLAGCLTARLPECSGIRKLRAEHEGKRSTFRVPSGQTLTVRYNESPETKLPIVPMAEATQKGN